MSERTCSGPDCTRAAGSSGLCRSHYQQRYLGKKLTPLLVATRDLGRPTLCTFRDCERPHKARGLCKAHNDQAVKGQTLRPVTVYGANLICIETGCERLSIARGRCAKHRQYLYDLAIKYSLTLEQYDALLEAQGGGCAICGGSNPNGYRLSVDHDHACCSGNSCGKCVRGLLCLKCNLILGHADDTAGRLRAAADYLDRRSVVVM